MKYIRTKDHFLGFYKEMSISLGGYSKGKYYRDVIDRRLHRLGAGILQEKYIINQAGTIEELCDEYVWDNCLIVFINKEKTQFVLKQAKAEYEEEYDINKDFDEDSSPIYGAIWTDKGELELL